MIFESGRPDTATLMPQPGHSAVAVPPPGTEPGTWAGAPSATRSNGDIYLAYRLRRPLGQGRGYAVAVARSSDGVRFETLLTIGRAEMGAESLERPALVQTPDGTWRLYLSCATTAHSRPAGSLITTEDSGPLTRWILRDQGTAPTRGGGWGWRGGWGWTGEMAGATGGG